MQIQRRIRKLRAAAGRRRSLVILLAAATIATVALAAIASAAGTSALDAGRSSQKRPRTGKPPFAWVEGELQRDRLGGWILTNGTPLQTAGRVTWREENGGETSPAAGRTARLMGQWYGGTFRVRQATLISPQHVIERLQPKPETIPDQPAPQQPM
ncbi:MAG: hypothetical protein PHQ53_13180 [Candidatus Krumholzibacteria bacterium]|nr:hypothetical protein [Candidatus Krumholzibacteria bacterium]